MTMNWWRAKMSTNNERSGIIEKISRRIIHKYLSHKGFSPLSSYLVLKELKEDFSGNQGLTLRQKLHAYRKGFYSERIRSYHLENEADYDSYIPEIIYYGLHPVNGRYSHWIDDKLTLRYLLEPFKEFLPKYYYQVDQAEVMRLPDCPEGYGCSRSDVIRLIRDVKEVAAKVLSGTKGDGFYKLGILDGSYYVNNHEVDVAAFNKIIDRLDGYLITEYVYCSDQLRKIYPNSSNTLRLSLLRDEEGPFINGAMMRYGTKKSGVVDNISCGGLFCGVELHSGKVFQPSYYDKDMKVIPMPIHPDTGEEVEITIEQWDGIVTTLNALSDYLPQLCYYGYDILITNEGFKIIEINSLQGMQHMQLFYPARGTQRSRRFYDRLFQNSSLKVGK